MKRRNFITALAGITIAGAAIGGGALVTGSAFASDSATNSAVAVVPASSGHGVVSCRITLEPVDIASHGASRDHAVDIAIDASTGLPTDDVADMGFVTEGHPAISGDWNPDLGPEDPLSAIAPGSEKECQDVTGGHVTGRP